MQLLVVNSVRGNMDAAVETALAWMLHYGLYSKELDNKELKVFLFGSAFC